LNEDRAGLGEKVKSVSGIGGRTTRFLEESRKRKEKYRKGQTSKKPGSR